MPGLPLSIQGEPVPDDGVAPLLGAVRSFALGHPANEVPLCPRAPE